MKADTKANLAWRVDCEYGATNGKFELAACAKKNGLDAIHDTVHEMARDEASADSWITMALILSLWRINHLPENVSRLSAVIYFERERSCG